MADAQRLSRRYFWWWDGSSMPELGAGLFGYIAGIQIERHTAGCRPGLWLARVTAFSMGCAHAVVDDFGNLVQVA